MTLDIFNDEPDAVAKSPFIMLQLLDPYIRWSSMLKLIYGRFSINGKEYNNPDMEMVIDIQEQKLHGNSGCNIMNGSLSINPDKSNFIKVPSAFGRKQR